MDNNYLRPKDKKLYKEGYWKSNEPEILIGGPRLGGVAERLATMSDLISREALLEYARNRVGHTIDCNDIARFPAVDAEPVRRGEWIPFSDHMWACSNCRVMGSPQWKRCPVCEAKMDGGLPHNVGQATGGAEDA